MSDLIASDFIGGDEIEANTGNITQLNASNVDVANNLNVDNNLDGGVNITSPLGNITTLSANTLSGFTATYSNIYVQTTLQLFNGNITGATTISANTQNVSQITGIEDFRSINTSQLNASNILCNANASMNILQANKLNSTNISNSNHITTGF